MLIIKKEPKDVFGSKSPEDSILIEPSYFVNNFLCKNLQKFGILKTPEKVLIEINNNPEKNILVSYLDEVSSPLRAIFKRPIYKNMELIFQSTAEKLKHGGNIFATPGAAALFLDWGFKNKMDLDFEIQADVELDTIYEEFSSLKNQSFVPIELERLLKLFSTFYGREIPFKEVEFIGDIQLKLISLDKKSEDLNVLNIKELKDIIEKTEKEKCSFSSNNIFNKILEIIETIDILQSKGYNSSIQNEFRVFNHLESSVEETKDYLKQILGGEA